ncbi:ABC transporter substrate-binding protein [Tropicimonas sp. IMCC34011]|uniref:ABC transporter substrate-binding protein n=1 Tax=Tropicimonas sp. IMCC34011 TaxID=2248759 RepID=UPI000E245D40|nr:ABC transporter substrate-binding protein [Tropicimonas sp. IMCC34011]
MKTTAPILAAALALPLTAHAQQEVSLALDWTLNTNHIGFIVAEENGYYDEAGLEVDILPYSDSSSTALLAAGVSDFAYMSSLSFISTRAAEADIVALWVTMQKETGRLVYSADNDDIDSPADLSGKTYAGFGTKWEDALISTMIEADGGDPTFDTVTLGTGAYEALANGSVDFTLEVSTWEGVNSELLNRNQKSFTYADYGIPEQQNGYIGTTGSFLAENPDLVASFMKATQRGYAWAAENPEEAADILIEAGDFPNPELVKGSMELIASGGYLDAEGMEVGEIDEAKVAGMANFLAESGVLTGADGGTLEEIGDISGWFDQSWMDE